MSEVPLQALVLPRKVRPPRGAPPCCSRVQGVPHLQEIAPLEDPTVGPRLGSWGVLGGWAFYSGRGTPVEQTFPGTSLFAASKHENNEIMEHVESLVPGPSPFGVLHAGAVAMPHNLLLQSALVFARKVRATRVEKMFNLKYRSVIFPLLRCAALKERCTPRQKSIVGRLEANVEPQLT